jgi:hypothetical protein
MNLQEIKSKYWLDNDSPLAVGKASEIRWLINEIERLQAENEKLKNPPVWTNDGEL